MNIVTTIFRVCMSIAVLALVLSVVDSAETWAVLSNTDYGVIIGATLLFLAQTPILAWRWRRIVQLLNGKLTFIQAVRFSLIGRLFNQIMPASIGGDAVRAWYGTRNGLSATISAHSVIIERVTGLLSLLVFAGFACLVLWLQVELPFVWQLDQVATGFGVVVLVGGIVVLNARRLRQLPLARYAFELWDDTVAVISDRRALALLGLSALASNLLAIAAAIVIGAGLGLQLNVWVYGLVVPVAIVMTIVPVSIGGWGVREGTMVFVLHLFDVPTPIALALSLLFGVTLLLAALVGGGCGYLIRATRSQSSDLKV